MQLSRNLQLQPNEKQLDSTKNHPFMIGTKTSPNSTNITMNSNENVLSNRPKQMVFLIYQGPESECNLFTTWNIEDLATQGFLRKRRVPTELTSQLQQVSEQKLQAVRNQHYELSASFRDQERKLLNEIWKEFVPQGYTSELILSRNETDYYFVAPFSILFQMKKGK